MNTNNDIIRITTVKIMFLGDTHVGKTSLINTYIGDLFNEDILNTIFPDYYISQLDVEDRSYKIKIYDIPGNERYRRQMRSYLRATKIIILVFDMTSKRSFLELDNILEIIEEFSDLKQFSYILIGNKADLIDRWEIKEKEGKQFAEIMNTKFFLSSAKIEPEKFKIFLDEYIEEYIKQHQEEFVINRQQNVVNLNRNERRRRNTCL